MTGGPEPDSSPHRVANRRLRTVAAAAALALVVGLLVGCGGSGGDCRELARQLAETEDAYGLVYQEHLAASQPDAFDQAEHNRTWSEMLDLRTEAIVLEAQVRNACS